MGATGLVPLGLAGAFALMFGGADPVVTVEFIQLPFLGAQLLGLSGYGSLAGTLSGDAESGSTPAASPSPTPAPEPARGPLALPGVGASSGTAFLFGGLLAILALLIFTAPRLGSRLRVPAASWQPPGYVSPLELPG
jgi:hypothetical protein